MHVTYSFNYSYIIIYYEKVNREIMHTTYRSEFFYSRIDKEIFNLFDLNNLLEQDVYR